MAIYRGGGDLPDLFNPFVTISNKICGSNSITVTLISMGGSQPHFQSPKPDPVGKIIPLRAPSRCNTDDQFVELCHRCDRNCQSELTTSPTTGFPVPTPSYNYGSWQVTRYPNMADSVLMEVHLLGTWWTIIWHVNRLVILSCRLCIDWSGSYSWISDCVLSEFTQWASVSWLSH